MSLQNIDDAPPCPFCGKPVDFEDADTLYPTGSGWKDDAEDNIRTYHRLTHVPRAQWCWGMHCPTPAGGCGAEVSGDSREEALAKWCTRALITNDTSQGE